MIWHAFGRHRWASTDGRYEIHRTKGADGRTVLCVLFYEFQALRLVEDYTSDHPPAALQRWCEDHRQRILPQVQEFEAWASRHYRADLYARGCGPIGRRNQLQELIRAAGDGALEFNWRTGRRSIAERFAELYQSIAPERGESESQRQKG